MNFSQREDGFTLLEVLAAITIFSVAILMFSTFFVYGFQTTKSEDKQLVAMNLARQVAEDWQNGRGVIDDAAHIQNSYTNDLTDYINKPLTFSELKDLIDPSIVNVDGNLAPNATPPIITFKTPIKINERNYNPVVTLSYMRTDSSSDLEKQQIIISVDIFDSISTTPLATVHGSMVANSE